MRWHRQSAGPPQRRRGVVRVAGWGATAAAALVALAETLGAWDSLLAHAWPWGAAPPLTGAASGLGADGEAGSVRTITGDVWQNNSRNVFLYNTAFRVAVTRATDDASAPRQELRDELLSVLDGLVGADQPLSAEQAQALGQRLGTVLDQAPLSSYRLNGGEFTLRPGKAFYLPDGDDSIALVGPAADGAPDAIAIRRNGRQSTMAVGAVREFRRGAETCRLLLHEIAPDFSAATFSYACRL